MQEKDSRQRNATVRSGRNAAAQVNCRGRPLLGQRRRRCFDTFRPQWTLHRTLPRLSNVTGCSDYFRRQDPTRSGRSETLLVSAPRRAAPRRPRPAPGRRSARCAARRAPLVVHGWPVHGGGRVRRAPRSPSRASAFDAGTALPAPRPVLGTPPAYRWCSTVARSLASGAPVVVVVRAPERDLQQPRSFFWISKSSSTCSSLRSSRRLSRSSSTTRLASGLTAFSLRPRRLGDRPASSPRSRARRQVTRCEEYSPSRRSNAPISPASRAASASRTMRRLYSAGNRRRLAFSGTSGSKARLRSESPRAGKSPVALRAPCDSPALTACCSSIASICSMVVSTALYTNFKEGRCLTYIGREG